MLIITAAYTGLRWGELVGLQWSRVDLDDGTVKVDAKVGALHEANGHLELGPPKTVASVRTVHRPPFLVDLLAEHRGRHPQVRYVFTASEGVGIGGRTSGAGSGCPRSTATRDAAGRQSRPICTSTIFGTHKTWMIEDEVPEVLQHNRLGHKFGGHRSG
ncbi:MAG TPA: hypothetical protein VNP92_13645 [Actinophytocola sp.]|nr:hypothetical protein [Actinophytocola sp.]